MGQFGVSGYDPCLFETHAFCSFGPGCGHSTGKTGRGLTCLISKLYGSLSQPTLLVRQGNGGSECGLWGPDGLGLYPGSSPTSCVLLARSLNSLAEKERSDCFPGSDGTSSRGMGCDRVMVWEATLLKVGPAPLHPAQGRMENGSESPARCVMGAVPVTMRRRDRVGKLRQGGFL